MERIKKEEKKKSEGGERETLPGEKKRKNYQKTFLEN